MIKNTGNRLAVVLVVLALLVAVQVCALGSRRHHRRHASHASAPTHVKKSKLQHDLGVKTKKIKAIKHQIAVTEIRRKDVLGQLSDIGQELETKQESLAGNKVKLQNAKADLDRTNQRLDRTVHQLSRRRGLLSRRVVDIYEGEDLNYVDVVLGSSDMWTFLTRAYYLQKILDSDTTLIGEIKADKDKIEKDKAHKVSLVNRISSTQSRLVAETDRIGSLQDQKESTLQAIEHDKELLQGTLDELEAESRKIETEIQQYQATPSGRRRDRIAAQFHGGVLRGGLCYPCSGRVTSPFGYRFHPILHVYKLHTGMDISVPTGTPLHAAGDGTVEKAEYNRAYGYMVTIYHGGGITTLYGHCSRLMVRAGQDVKKGQVIALSGSTGYATGPHCHFEKRVNGRPVNPAL